MSLLSFVAHALIRNPEFGIFGRKLLFNIGHCAHSFRLNGACPRRLRVLRGLVTSHVVLVFPHYFTWPFNFVLMVFWWHILCALMIICKERETASSINQLKHICNVSISMMSFDAWGSIQGKTYLIMNEVRRTYPSTNLFNAITDDWWQTVIGNEYKAESFSSKFHQFVYFYQNYLVTSEYILWISFPRTWLNLYLDIAHITPSTNRRSRPEQIYRFMKGTKKLRKKMK